ncbi:MAG: PAC2 family protein [Candidatus Asgardarchaeia archaeon]
MLIKEYVPLSKEELRSPIVVIGLPGIGLVGKIAVDTIIEYSNPKKIADLYPFDFPPRVVVDSNGIPKAIKVSIYLWKRNEEPDIILITSDAQPYSIEGQYKLAKDLLEYLNKIKVSAIIACAASVTPVIEGNPKVHVTTASKDLMNRFLKHPLTIPFKNGIISGGNGLIPVLAQEIYGITGACLLAETQGIGDQIDPKASKSIILVLNDIYGLNVELDKLDEKIKILEKEKKIISTETKKERKTPEEGTQSYIS